MSKSDNIYLIGETAFFDRMGELIAKSKAVTADMEALLAELDSTVEPFRHEDGDE